jgi:NitT/TauT family transport system substrate-binding protein
MGQTFQRIIGSLLFSVALTTLFCQGCTKRETPSWSGPPTKIIIGIFKGENSAVAYVAEQSGYFRQMGLEVELREVSSGVAAMAELNQGRVDIALSAEFVFVSNIDKHPDLRIAASLNRISSVHLVARKDRGISSPADLKGKRIAVVSTSIGEYFLGKFLHSNRLRLDEVTIVDMTPPMMEQEIGAGSVDAAIAWDPVSWRLRESLGSQAVSWPAQAESVWHLVLVAREKFIKKEPAAMVRLMKALLMAEKTMANDPATAKRDIAKRLGLTENYLAAVWGDNQFKVSLDRSLMLNLEEQSRWIGTMQGAAGLKQPNYLEFIYFDALEAARSESVTIIH